MATARANRGCRGKDAHEHGLAPRSDSSPCSSYKKFGSLLARGAVQAGEVSVPLRVVSPRQSAFHAPDVGVAVIAARGGHRRFRRSARWMLAAAALLACGEERAANTTGRTSAATGDSTRAETPAPRQEEPTQWTLREVARRLTDGGLVVTDSGRASVRHSFLTVAGHHLKVSGSDLHVFIYPDPGARKADSDRIDPVRVAPETMIIDWVATPHLIASGNLLAIHLTLNERLAERVRLILEAWHADSD